MDEDQRIHEELREQFGLQERKINIITSELEELRAALESNERARKLDEYHKRISFTYQAIHEFFALFTINLYHLTSPNRILIYFVHCFLFVYCFCV